MLTATTLCAACLVTPSAVNLDFQRGDLSGWSGDGFYLTTAHPRGPRGIWAVCSSDAGSPKRKGLIRNVFIVPDNIAEIRCRAYAGLPKGVKQSHDMDVLLLRLGKRIVPKEVRTQSIWLPARNLMPRSRYGSREYVWDVSALAGQTVQMVLVDFDERPGCHVYCSGFRMIRNSAVPPRPSEFDQKLAALAVKHGLPSMARYDSTHFVAVSNSGHRFTRSRLQWCEYFLEQFFKHFAKKGFPATRPIFRMKVVAFASPKGFDAYLKKRSSSQLTGIYQPRDNHLVLYDYRNNRNLVASMNKAMTWGERMDWRLRDEHKAKVAQVAEEIAVERNLSTVLHETAHLLSFNCGILNRKGDAPLWLVEGLACYCEPATKDGWKGFGAMNRNRLEDLIHHRKHLLPLKTLVANDKWRSSTQSILAGYAQSWALFRWLMETRPRALVKYCRLIYPRQAPEHRLTDFAQCFGADWPRLQTEYGRYVAGLMARE